MPVSIYTLCSHMSDFSKLGGQKQAQRISKLLQASKHKLSKLLVQYFQLQRESGEDLQLTTEEVCDLGSHFWVTTDHAYSYSDLSMSIPPASQRRLIELWRLRKRANEERQLLVSECIRMVQFYDQPSYVESVAINSQWLHLQCQRCESVCRTLVQAYWAEDTHAQTLLNVARRQCRREIVHPTEPLYMDGSPDGSESPVPQEEDLDSQSSSDESRLDEDEPSDSSSSDDA